MIFPFLLAAERRRNFVDQFHLYYQHITSLYLHFYFKAYGETSLYSNNNIHQHTNFIKFNILEQLLL